MKRGLLLWPLALSVLVGCGGNPSSALLHFGDGRTWYYSQDRKYVVVATCRKENARFLLRFARRDLPMYDEEYVVSQEGVFLMARRPIGLDVPFSPQQRVLGRSARAGVRWGWEGTIGRAVARAQSVAADEVVKVPYGRVKTLKVTTMLTVGSEESRVIRWYGKNVGLVKEVRMAKPSGASGGDSPRETTLELVQVR